MSQVFPARSLAEISTLLDRFPGISEDAVAAARTRQDSLTKPPGSLGRLEELAVFMAGWQETEKPRICTAQALVFAGNHGICDQGVNPYPQAVTAQMVANFENGGAAINQLCAANDAVLDVVALDLDRPTKDFTTAPAMSEQETLDAMAVGAGRVNSDADIIILGEMGIGNSTVAAALACAVFKGGVPAWVGPGTGSDQDGMARKSKAVAAGIDRHHAVLDDPLQILASLGGREQAAICGAVIEARQHRIPVILDGFIATAAAAPLSQYRGLLDHCLVGHQSTEPGHRRLLEAMKKKPILQMDMRLGEGSGAALALGIIRAALACHNGMSTFAEAGVSGG